MRVLSLCKTIYYYYGDEYTIEGPEDPRYADILIGLQKLRQAGVAYQMLDSDCGVTLEFHAADRDKDDRSVSFGLADSQIVIGGEEFKVFTRDQKLRLYETLKPYTTPRLDKT